MATLVKPEALTDADLHAEILHLLGLRGSPPVSSVTSCASWYFVHSLRHPDQEAAMPAARRLVDLLHEWAERDFAGSNSP